MVQLRTALEASWCEKTAYLGVKQSGNPALGQCYPTSRLIKYFFPKMQLVKGQIWNGKEIETHFWNILEVDGIGYHIDFTWQQFPAGSYVKSYERLSLEELNDSEPTIERCKLLRQRVTDFINTSSFAA